MNARPGGVLHAARDFIGSQSRGRLWGAVGVLVLLTVLYQVTGRDATIPVGVVVPNLIPAPMSAAEATNTLNAVNRVSPPEVRAGELVVRFPKATFPERRRGQLALAQQYARADEIVEGRQRAISFLDPDGNRFARAEPAKGVSMTR